jgi:hypothetical protein
MNENVRVYRDPTRTFKRLIPREEGFVAEGISPLTGTSLVCVLSFLVCMLEHRFEFFFERSRRDS